MRKHIFRICFVCVSIIFILNLTGIFSYAQTHPANALFTTTPMNATRWIITDWDPIAVNYGIDAGKCIYKEAETKYNYYYLQVIQKPLPTGMTRYQQAVIQKVVENLGMILLNDPTPCGWDLFVINNLKQSGIDDPSRVILWKNATNTYGYEAAKKLFKDIIDRYSYYAGILTAQGISPTSALGREKMITLSATNLRISSSEDFMRAICAQRSLTPTDSRVKYWAGKLARGVPRDVVGPCFDLAIQNYTAFEASAKDILRKQYGRDPVYEELQEKIANMFITVTCYKAFNNQFIASLKSKVGKTAIQELTVADFAKYDIYRVTNYQKYRTYAIIALALVMKGDYKQAAPFLKAIVDGYNTQWAYVQPPLPAIQYPERESKWAAPLTTYPFALAAWFSWNNPALTTDLKTGILRVLNSEGTYWYNNTPVKVSDLNGDSKAEDIGWTAQSLSLSGQMCNYQTWKDRANQYASQTFTITGVNATLTPGYLMPNHGYLPHPQYALGTIGFLGGGALIYKLTSADIPIQFKNNVLNVWAAHKPYINFKNWKWQNVPWTWTDGRDDWGVDVTFASYGLAYLDYIGGIDRNMFTALLNYDYQRYINEGQPLVGSRISAAADNPGTRLMLESVGYERYIYSALFNDPTRRLP